MLLEPNYYHRQQSHFRTGDRRKSKPLPFSAASPMQDPRGDPDPSHLLVAYSNFLHHSVPYYTCIYKALYIDALCLSRKSSGPRRGDVFLQQLSLLSSTHSRRCVDEINGPPPASLSRSLFLSLPPTLPLFFFFYLLYFFSPSRSIQPSVGRSSIEERRTQKLCLRQIGIDSRPRNPIGRLWDSETASPKQTGCLGCQW